MVDALVLAHLCTDPRSGSPPYTLYCREYSRDRIMYHYMWIALDELGKPCRMTTKFRKRRGRDSPAFTQQASMNDGLSKHQQLSRMENELALDRLRLWSAFLLEGWIR